MKRFHTSPFLVFIPKKWIVFKKHRFQMYPVFETIHFHRETVGRETKTNAPFPYENAAVWTVPYICLDSLWTEKFIAYWYMWIVYLKFFTWSESRLVRYQAASCMMFLWWDGQLGLQTKSGWFQEYWPKYLQMVNSCMFS